MAKRLKAEAHYECQICHRVTNRLAVHHIRPIETAKTVEEMEHLCFMESNLQVICYECHSAIHKGEGTTTKAGHQKAEDQRIDRYMSGTLDIDTLSLIHNS